MKVRFQVFHGERGWDQQCEKAAAFANGIAPDRLISIAHSQSMSGAMIVTVWYWDLDAQA